MLKKAMLIIIMFCMLGCTQQNEKITRLVFIDEDPKIVESIKQENGYQIKINKKVFDDLVVQYECYIPIVGDENLNVSTSLFNLDNEIILDNFDKDSSIVKVDDSLFYLKSDVSYNNIKDQNRKFSYQMTLALKHNQDNDQIVISYYSKQLEDILNRKEIENEEPNQNNKNAEETKVSTNESTFTTKQILIQQSIQETNYYCVPACAQMVLNNYGIVVSQEELAIKMNTSSITGTEYVDLEQTLNFYLGEGYYRVNVMNYGAINQNDLDLLEERILENLNLNKPVFIAVELSTLYPDLGIHANHMVLITGSQFDNEGHLMNYIVDDPYEPVLNRYPGNKFFSKEIVYQSLLNNGEPAYVY